MKYSNRKFVIAHALGRAFTRCFNVRTAGAITAMMFTYQAQAIIASTTNGQPVLKPRLRSLTIVQAH